MQTCDMRGGRYVYKDSKIFDILAAYVDEFETGKRTYIEKTMYNNW